MGREVHFYLGPGGTHLERREFEIYPIPAAGETKTPDAVHSNLSITNTDTIHSVELDDRRMYVAVLQDVFDDGGVIRRSERDKLPFHTGELQFPGPRTGDRLRIIGMEDMSSSSSSSS